MDGSDFFQDDCDSIATEMKDQEERIRLKRRWLLGLDTPKPENHTTESLESEDHTPGKTEFLESECLPESLLREDDLFYETAKSRVEEAFGFCRNQDAQQRKDSKFCTKDVVTRLSMYLDSLTNEGLSLVVKIITGGGGSTSFDKTRPKMKQIIRESLRTDLKERGRGRDDVVEQLHQALIDPGNFRKDCTMDSAKPMFPSHRDAAVKILNELDKSSTQTLLAMKRKLEGSVTIPRLKQSKTGGKKTDLINQVKQASEKMLSELSTRDNKLPEPLAKAMSLVDLSLQLSPGHNKTTAPTDFFQFSPETKKLQKEIVKAVWLLRTARIDAAFERVGLVLDPESQVSNHSLRSAVERMLIEYLFECCDMDVIPKSLTDALSLVNKTTQSLDHRVCPGEAIEEETECVLNVSAQVKQIVWECRPDYELDQDFGDAYMEELEDSDDDDYSQDDAFDASDPDQDEVGAECSVLNPAISSDATNQHRISSSLVIRDLTESVTRPRSLFATPTSNKSTPLSDNTGTTKAGRDVKVGVDNQISPRSLYSVENIKSDDHGAQQKPIKRKKNQYLAVQEICDDTSLVAYNLIGRLLEKFAVQKGLDLEVDQRSYLRGESWLQEVSEEKQASQFQGKSYESITLSAVQETMPSLDKSVLLKLKELME
ncbi:hypothetical protein Bca52824_008030 [Brassica carinata]|uniref:Uncharacterized protein n=1 Tax=Brassica carinata TaxID=52824 RepID=A0A8X8B8T8_BRACI|nr:hypothetical protein Bca52824_008030 [Brassica carinata]